MITKIYQRKKEQIGFLFIICSLLFSVALTACSDQFLQDKKNYDNVTTDVYNYIEGANARLNDLYAWCLPQAADLSLEQIEIITRTVNTPRKDFTARVIQLSQKVQQKLCVQRQEPTDIDFLRRILRDYQYYALEEI